MSYKYKENPRASDCGEMPKLEPREGLMSRLRRRLIDLEPLEPVDPVIEKIRRRERFWRRATTLTFAVSLIILGLIGWPLVEQIYAGIDLNTRLDLLWRVGVLFAAAVTTCSILWRGATATRQADTQIKQIGNVAEQIELTRDQIEITREQLELTQIKQENEDGERAIKLLQDGTELLHAEQPARVVAGLVTLLHVANDHREEVARDAVELLVAFQLNLVPDFWNERCDLVSERLREIGVSRQRTLKKQAKVTGNVDLKGPDAVADLDVNNYATTRAATSAMAGYTNCGLIHGVETVVYDRAFIVRQTIVKQQYTNEHHSFRCCIFLGTDFSEIREGDEPMRGSMDFEDCIFIDCTFSISDGSNFHFSYCRFVNATGRTLPDLRGQCCWYLVGEATNGRFEDQLLRVDPKDTDAGARKDVLERAFADYLRAREARQSE